MKFLLKKFWIQNLLIIFFYFIINISYTVFLMGFNYLIDGIINQKNSKIFLWIGIMCTCIFLNVFLKYINNLYQFKVQKLQINYLKILAAHKIAKTSYFDFKSKNIGNYLAWFNFDMNQVESQGLLNFYQFINGLTFFIFNIIGLFIISWIITLITIFFIILAIAFPILLNNFIQNLMTHYQKNNEELSGKILRLFNLLNLFVLNNSESKFKKLFNDKIKSMSNLLISVSKKMLPIQYAASSSVIFGSAFTVVVTAILIFHNFLEIASFITIINLSNALINGGFNFIFNLFALNGATSFVSKFLKSNNNNKKINNTQKLKENLEFSSLNLKQLSFAYDKKKVINNLNFEFYKNKKYAIVANSGSGKSTLIKILAGVYKNYDGSVLWNNKIEIKKLDEKILRNQIGYVDNQNFIFNETFVNNITLWDELNLDKYRKILSQLELNNLPKKEIINNQNLSEGQKQRITLARLLYEDKPILLFDEAIDNLDKYFQQKVEKLILEMDNKTVILVTHHLSDKLIKHFDEILYL